MGRIIDGILIIAGLICAFLVGMLIANLATASELPQELAFLNNYPTLVAGDCTERATGKHFDCEYKVSPSGEYSFLLVYDKGELYEAVQSDDNGNFEIIYKAAKKLGS